ncbi:hypothetical protein CU102_00490 [Phyllobacterium brassicacearum]|uniref:DUF6456 domain-containing protein n=1 Tax=Phyllobacterium brassicacearum TaxID=314235 RepID=A0A2P7BVV5_9HYPH|nr:DUF6456 domain-containing protein [Phyllobacterium brassicacearum]PSH70576.1 hypothetical protein CU102_00490 [Phyllobacterium brassicacearum]TDQ35969.1 hypothetical protein DEV91_101455 [Phyllobacterium brassicacearum]
MTVPAQGKAAGNGVLRLLRFIAKGAVEIVESPHRNKLTLESGTYGTISVERDAVKSALSQGLATVVKTRLAICDAGRARLRRHECTDDPFAGQHRREETIVTTDGNGATTPLRGNAAESPLAMLRQRRDAFGAPLVGEEAFKAGERLRADFTIGNMMPSIGVNWDVTGSGSRCNGMLEITDAALAARQRAERALEAVGPELSGVLIDVFCFLKGLEAVERERRWPVRSAKLILKTALAALDRHYYPAPPSRSSPRIIHWGTKDYRPEVRR